MTHAADRDAPDVISTGVYYDHSDDLPFGEGGHAMPGGRVFGILPIRYADCERYGCKPVVVIDPEDDEQVARWRSACHGNPPGAYCRCCDGSVEATRQALRSLVAPLKPDEPTGLGAVVEVPSSQAGRGLRRLVRGHATREPWMGDGRAWAWVDIIGPVSVLSEGVTE